MFLYRSRGVWYLWKGRVSVGREPIGSCTGGVLACSVEVSASGWRGTAELLEASEVRSDLPSLLLLGPKVHRSLARLPDLLTHSSLLSLLLCGLVPEVLNAVMSPRIPVRFFSVSCRLVMSPLEAFSLGSARVLSVGA